MKKIILAAAVVTGLIAAGAAQAGPYQSAATAGSAIGGPDWVKQAFTPSR